MRISSKGLSNKNPESEDNSEAQMAKVIDMALATTGKDIQLGNDPAKYFIE